MTVRKGKVLGLSVIFFLMLFAPLAFLRIFFHPFALAVEGNLVDLILKAEKSAYETGEIFTVELNAQAGAQPVVGLQVYLNFDPQYLQIVDQAGNPANLIEASNVFNALLLNQVDNSKGQIGYAAGTLTGNFPSGNFNLGILRFKALSSTQAQPTKISFSRTRPRDTIVVAREQSVLGNAAELSLTIAGASLCPNKDQGNLDCDPGGLINETDLQLLLQNWGAPYASADLLNLFSHWRP